MTRSEQKTRLEWVTRLCRELNTTFRGIGFRPSGKTAYVKREQSVTKSWRLNWRFPKFADDPHQVYVDPRIGVSLPEVDQVVSLLTNVPTRKDYSTIGGTIGLFGPDKSLRDLPIDSPDDVPNVAARLREDLLAIAVPFWDKLESPDKILDAITSGAHVVGMDSDAVVALAVCGIVKGRDAALEFAALHFKMLRRQNPGWKFDEIQNRVRKVFGGNASR